MIYSENNPVAPIMHQDGVENKKLSQVMGVMFTNFSLKGLCLWELCKSPAERRNFMEHWLNAAGLMEYRLQANYFSMTVD